MLAADALLAFAEHRASSNGAPSALVRVGALLENEKLLHLRAISGVKVTVFLPSTPEDR